MLVAPRETLLMTPSTRETSRLISSTNTLEIMFSSAAASILNIRCLTDGMPGARRMTVPRWLLFRLSLRCSAALALFTSSIQFRKSIWLREASMGQCFNPLLISDDSMYGIEVVECFFANALPWQTITNKFIKHYPDESTIS